MFRFAFNILWQRFKKKYILEQLGEQRNFHTQEVTLDSWFSVILNIIWARCDGGYPLIFHTFSLLFWWFSLHVQSWLTQHVWFSMALVYLKLESVSVFEIYYANCASTIDTHYSNNYDLQLAWHSSNFESVNILKAVGFYFNNFFFNVKLMLLLND